MPISTDTYIRRAEREDLDTVVAWMQEPDFQQFLYGDPARSPRQLREQIVSMLGRTAGHTMPGAVYLIIDSKEHGPIGMLSLQNISWRNRSCSIDLYIGNTALRNGMISGVATYRALEYCFDELNLHRAAAFIYAFNAPSWRLFEHFGGVREIVMPKHVLRDGVLHDGYGYGFLRAEFDTLREKFGRQLGGVNLEAMIEGLAKNEDAAP